ncbi:hypothetical protein DMENIID0001_024680 [Sergentomyia squamirostris]
MSSSLLTTSGEFLSGGLGEGLVDGGEGRVGVGDQEKEMREREVLKRIDPMAKLVIEFEHEWFETFVNDY